jgi:DNA-binding ferritin-like protein
MTLDHWKTVFDTLQLAKDIADLKEALAKIGKKTKDASLKKGIENALRILDAVPAIEMVKAADVKTSKKAEEEFKKAVADASADLKHDTTKVGSPAKKIMEKTALVGKWNELLKTPITDESSAQSQAKGKTDGMNALGELLDIMKKEEIPSIKAHCPRVSAHIRGLRADTKEQERWMKQAADIIDHLPDDLEKWYDKEVNGGSYVKLAGEVADLTVILEKKPIDVIAADKKRVSVAKKLSDMRNAISDYDKEIDTFFIILDKLNP